MPSVTVTHGGSRKGAGRKPALHPKKQKAFRPPSEEAWQEFLSYLSGDLVEDFEIVLYALRASRSLTFLSESNSLTPLALDWKSIQRVKHE